MKTRVIVTPADKIKTELDKTIDDKFKSTQKLALKVAHFNPELVQRGLAHFLQAFAEFTIDVFAAIHGVLERAVRKLQGRKVPKHTGSPSVFLKEVQYYKEEKIEEQNK